MITSTSSQWRHNESMQAFADLLDDLSLILVDDLIDSDELLDAMNQIADYVYSDGETPGPCGLNLLGNAIAKATDPSDYLDLHRGLHALDRVRWLIDSTPTVPHWEKTGGNKIPAPGFESFETRILSLVTAVCKCNQAYCIVILHKSINTPFDLLDAARRAMLQSCCGSTPLLSKPVLLEPSTRIDDQHLNATLYQQLMVQNQWLPLGPIDLGQMDLGGAV